MLQRSLLVFCLLLLCGCGEPLNMSSLSQGTVSPTAYSSQGLFEASSTPFPTLVPIPAPIETPVATSAPLILPEGALATFDPNKPSTLPVGGLGYTLNECVAYSCRITLQNGQNTQVWVTREALGMEKFVPTPVTVYVPFTPVPKPPCATFNGPAGSVYVCGWGDLNELGKQEYIRQFGGNAGEQGQPGQCSACSKP